MHITLPKNGSLLYTSIPLCMLKLNTLLPLVVVLLFTVCMCKYAQSLILFIKYTTYHTEFLTRIWTHGPWLQDHSCIHCNTQTARSRVSHGSFCVLFSLILWVFDLLTISHCITGPLSARVKIMTLAEPLYDSCHHFKIQVKKSWIVVMVIQAGRVPELEVATVGTVTQGWRLCAHARLHCTYKAAQNFLLDQYMWVLDIQRFLLLQRAHRYRTHRNLYWTNRHTYWTHRRFYRTSKDSYWAGKNLCWTNRNHYWSNAHFYWNFS